MAIGAANEQQSVWTTFLAVLPSVLSTMAGGLIGLVAAWITNRSAIHRMQVESDDRHATAAKDKKRERADELYTMFSAWAKMLGSYHMTAISTWTGKVNYNDLLDLREKAVNQYAGKYNFERIEMLAMAFFPDLLPTFNQVLSARDTLAERDSLLRAAYRSGHFNPSSPDPLIGECATFHNLSERLKAQIIQEIIALN